MRKSHRSKYVIIIAIVLIAVAIVIHYQYPTLKTFAISPIFSGVQATSLSQVNLTNNICIQNVCFNRAWIATVALNGGGQNLTFTDKEVNSSATSNNRVAINFFLDKFGLKFDYASNLLYNIYIFQTSYIQNFMPSSVVDFLQNSHNSCYVLLYTYNCPYALEHVSIDGNNASRLNITLGGLSVAGATDGAQTLFHTVIEGNPAIINNYTWACNDAGGSPVFDGYVEDPQPYGWTEISAYFSCVRVSMQRYATVYGQPVSSPYYKATVQVSNSSGQLGTINISDTNEFNSSKNFVAFGLTGYLTSDITLPQQNIPLVVENLSGASNGKYYLVNYASAPSIAQSQYFNIQDIVSPSVNVCGGIYGCGMYDNQQLSQTLASDNNKTLAFLTPITSTSVYSAMNLSGFGNGTTTAYLSFNNPSLKSYISAYPLIQIIGNFSTLGFSFPQITPKIIGYEPNPFKAPSGVNTYINITVHNNQSIGGSVHVVLVCGSSTYNSQNTFIPAHSTAEVQVDFVSPQGSLNQSQYTTYACEAQAESGTNAGNIFKIPMNIAGQCSTPNLINTSSCKPLTSSTTINSTTTIPPNICPSGVCISPFDLEMMVIILVIFIVVLAVLLLRHKKHHHYHRKIRRGGGLY